MLWRRNIADKLMEKIFFMLPIFKRIILFTIRDSSRNVVVGVS